MKSALLLILACAAMVTGYAQEKNNAIQKKTDSTARHLKEVVVTGQYRAQSSGNSVYQTRVISAEQIRLRAATNVQQVLSTELGFRFSNDFATGTSDIQLMGMDGRNVKILLDGVAMVDRSDTRESLNQVDINTIERIEIIEGPLAVSYGSDALAGVINIITRKPGKAVLNINARVQEETVGDRYAPFAKEGLHVQNVGASWQDKGFSVLGGVTHNEFNGFNVPAATASSTEIDVETNRWKPKEQWMANTKLGYSTANFNIWYRLDGVEETIDAKGAYNSNTFKASKAQYITNRYTQQLQGDYRLNDRILINGVLGYTRLKRATVTHIHNYATGTEELDTAKGTQDIDRFNSLNFRSTVWFKMTDRVSFQPGLELNHDYSVGSRITGSPSIDDYAFFISAELDLFKDVVLRPGLRFIHNSVYDAPPVIPSLNLKAKLNESLDLRFGYASGFRSPALRELYYNFFDASHSIMGNANLKAEQSNSFNASVTFSEVNAEGLHFKSVLGGFYNNFRNRIDYAPYAADNTITTLINVDKYRTTGGTWENSVFGKNFRVSLGFSLVGTYNKYAAEEELYGASAVLVWTPELNSTISYSFENLGTTVNLAYKFTGKRPVYQLIPATAEAAERVWLAKTGAFSMADLMITKKIRKSLAFNAGVRNLLNVTKVSNTAVDTGSAHSTGSGPLPLNYGRSYVLGLSFNLDVLPANH